MIHRGGKRAGERVCLSYIIKDNFVAKNMEILCCFYPVVYYICLVSVFVGFGSFAVVCCKDLWRSDMEL